MSSSSHFGNMDDYVVLEHIGEGSFGKVYKGRRRNTGLTVAMKFITKHGKTEKDIKNLREEIRILRTLNHENIVLMFDAIETDREFCVVTEYAQGELFDILQDDKRLPEETVQKIAKQLVKALQYLHSNRIIHRDMKPQNVLIGANGQIKLCDFGFARSMSTNTIVLTSIKGTPLYMSPELVKEQPYDNASDLWSLGVILFELFVGQPPFYTNSIYSLINHIVKDPVKYPPDVSKEFKSFLSGLLQKNPSRRLNWPDLANHPFVAETEADRERIRAELATAASYGGQGGPRQRLAHIMGSNQGDLLRTANIRGPVVCEAPESVGELPYAKMKREKMEAAQKRRAMRSRVVSLSPPCSNSPMITPVRETHSAVPLSADITSLRRAWDQKSPDLASALSALEGKCATPDITIGADESSARSESPRSEVLSELITPVVDRAAPSRISMLPTPPLFRGPSSVISPHEESAEEGTESFSGLKGEQTTILISEGSVHSSYSHVFEEDLESNEDAKDSSLKEISPLPESNFSSFVSDKAVDLFTEHLHFWEELLQEDIETLKAIVLSQEFSDRLTILFVLPVGERTSLYFLTCSTCMSALSKVLTTAVVDDNTESRTVLLFISFITQLIEFCNTVQTHFTTLLVSERTSKVEDCQSCASILKDSATIIGYLFIVSRVSKGAPLSSDKLASVSVADRWSCTSLLINLLKLFDSKEISSYSIEVCASCLQSIGAVISHSYIDGFNMLLALQLPTALISILLKVSSADLETFLTTSTFSDKSHVLLYSLHNISLLLHTSGNQWTFTTMYPITGILHKKDDVESRSNYSSIAERVALRNRIHGVLCDKMKEKVNGSTGFTILQEILQVTLHRNHRSCSSSIFCSSRVASLRILLHLCSSVIRSDIIDEVAIIELLCNFLTTLAAPVDEQLYLSSGLALLIISYLLQASKLYTNKLLRDCVESVIGTMSKIDDIRIHAAGLRALSIVIVKSCEKDHTPDAFDSISNSSQLVTNIISNLLHHSLDADEEDSSPSSQNRIINKGRASAWLSGSIYGLSMEGFFDSAITTLALLVIHPSMAIVEALFRLSPSVCKLIQAAGFNEMSPIGMAAALVYLNSQFVHQIASCSDDNSLEIAVDSAKSNGIIALMSLTCLPQHIDDCVNWIAASKDKDNQDLMLHALVAHEFSGQSIIECIVSPVGRLLNEILKVAAVLKNAKLAHSIYDAAYKTQCLKCMIEALRSFGGYLSAGAISIIVQILSDLVLTSNKFMNQFMDYRGLHVIDDLGVFEISREDFTFNDALIAALQLASHLIRSSEQYCNALQEVLKPEKLSNILTMGDSAAKAKCCNLLGNLCRHSSRFYSVLIADLGNISILDILIDSCAASDPNVKKFACFAVGNAAFHSDSLYSHLITAIPILREALLDDDEKTRANAAGALGNLCRNSGMLSETISESGVIENLISMSITDSVDTCQRIALFSLGTMAVYKSCRSEMLSGDITASDLVAELRESPDESIRKNIARLRQKLKQPITQ